MKFDSRSADAVRHVDFVVNKPGIPNVAPLSPRLKHRLVGVGAAAMLAFAVGLLVAIFGARAADAPAKPQHAAERAATDSVRVQPTAKQFAPPNQPTLNARDASDIDQLYRQLMGPAPATSSGSGSSTRLRAVPSDDAAAGSVRRWGNPR
jgi:hypothetical protein